MIRDKYLQQAKRFLYGPVTADESPMIAAMKELSSAYGPSAEQVAQFVQDMVVEELRATANAIGASAGVYSLAYENAVEDRAEAIEKGNEPGII